ncbi:hypothetical protein GGI00_003584 [Coemansia sp. RSA 2681]|nr:hypothetical protein GGI00_003584 [Coemansia sp. RSA 2681]
MPFPAPRTGSERWRAYLQQRREYGDAQTRCPDAMREAEALFEIDCSVGTHDALDSPEPGRIVDYKALQLLQNRDWARRIALSVSEDISDYGQDGDTLAKLDHAVELDPDCAVALCRRARL